MKKVLRRIDIMGWRDNPREHAELWNSALLRAMGALGKNDLMMAQAVFAHNMEGILDGLPDNEAVDAKLTQMFVAWVVSEYLKDGKPAGEWYCGIKNCLLTTEEKEVLLAGKESHFGIFLVKSHVGKVVRLEDAHGTAFAVETVSLPQMEADTAIMTRINAKGEGRYFFSGSILIWEKKGIYDELKLHYAFRKRWSSYLERFVDYQMKEMSLARKTAEKHMEDVNLLMFLLERKQGVDSFGKVTKGMLNTEFKKFVKRHILNRVDMDKTYYSLRLFFNFLKEKKEDYNEEALEWLRRRTD